MPIAGPALLREAQVRRIEPCFPLYRGRARVDDRRVLSGIAHVIRHWLRWQDAPPGYNGKPHAVGDEHGRPRALLLTEGEVGDYKGAATMLPAVPNAPATGSRSWSAGSKDRCRVATRYDRCARTFLNAVALAAAVISWLPR